MLSSLPAAACLAAVAIGMAGACRVAVSGVVLRDDLQREVAFARSPRRIVTLMPSLTETVCALGGCGLLVATDRYSDWPAQARALPKAGGLDDVSVELIVSLTPDLVLLSRSERVNERLGDLGVRTFVLNSQNFADIGRTVTLVGRILGVPERAAELARSIDAAVGDVARTAIARRHGARPSVYFEVDQAPYAAGPDSFIGELLARLGARNIVTADLGPFPKLNPEYVVRHDPDVIFLSSAEAQGSRLALRPGWDTLRAVRENRLCSFGAVVRDTIVRPGPRVAEGMRALAGCLERRAP